MPVKGIPMISEADVIKHFMVLEHLPTMLRLKVITRTSGVPNGDKVQTLEQWDFISKD